MFEVPFIGGDARSTMDEKRIGASSGLDVQSSAPCVQARIRSVAANRRVPVVSRHGRCETHPPLTSSSPERGNAMFARRTSEDNVQFDFVRRRVNSRGRHRPFRNGSGNRVTRLRDGGKRRSGGKREKRAAQHRSHDILR